MSKHRYPRHSVQTVIDPWAIGFTIAAVLALIGASIFAFLW